MHLRGRLALVTGASSGIGRATALALAEAGLQVVAAARRRDRLEALAEHPAIRAAPLDVRDEAAVVALFAELEQDGGPDVLVNNAGLGYLASLSDGSTDEWREMLEVNVLALSVCTREALRSMARRGVDDGHIVHISSMSGHRVTDGGGMYAASKHAVRALTESLRRELRAAGSAIRVTSVSPGLVRTEFAAHMLGSEEGAAETYGRFEVLHAEDVARAVLFALEAPARAEFHDILVRPTAQRT